GEDDILYVYATNALGFNIQYATASQSNIGSWTYVNEDALPDSGFPSWGDSDNGYTWAPSVMNINGVFNMYYTARDISANTQCIGRAVSSTAGGPFSDSSASPFLCQNSLGGTIDAQPFQDTDGTLYLLYKNDGNSIGPLCTLTFPRLVFPQGSIFLPKLLKGRRRQLQSQLEAERRTIAHLDRRKWGQTVCWGL
ncbi:hypothetical protein WJX74_004994, partial [Apatococcus lobatus]